jgi:hypothetical protein
VAITSAATEATYALRLAESGTPRETFDVLAEATGRREGVRSNHSKEG